ncbi:MAG: ABC transporter ATP-binding protein [Candidatus Heimdallarchaeota archaeon]|nr:ABC transporter ATP-binding protein [Candidatus Heimdallarchaeota archaeon]
MTTIIETKNLSKIYGKKQKGTVGIENLSLRIKKGDIYGFLGQNGAGKTTTIRCLLSILLPTEGECYINGVSVNRDNPGIRREIGYLPGELNIPANYTVKGYLSYISSLRKAKPSRLEEMISLFDVPMDKKIGQLSKGNKQKVGICIAWMHDPQIFILDEPSSGLDPIFQQRLYQLIDKERESGKTIFFSSHNLDEVQRVCDKVAIIREGRLVSEENVKELAGKVTRKLRLVLDVLNPAELAFLGEDLLQINEASAEVLIRITDHKKIAEIIERLPSIKDMSYAPASLEEYFLSKYRE